MKMTNDTAFDLGAFNYSNFYDWAVRVGDSEFDYTDFFKWDGEYGKLDESKFETLEHKYYYIKGRLSSYSVSIKDNSITVVYANSIKSRDRFVRWICELIIFKFGKNAIWSIKTTSGSRDIIPCTPGLVLNADKKIINYFIGVVDEKIFK